MSARDLYGAVLYTVYKNKIYVIMSKTDIWLHFAFPIDMSGDEKTPEHAIANFVFNRTSGLVHVDPATIQFDCKFSEHDENYNFALVCADCDVVKKLLRIPSPFPNALGEPKQDTSPSEFRMFQLTDFLSQQFHHVALTPVMFYWNVLKDLQNKQRGAPFEPMPIETSRKNIKKYNSYAPSASNDVSYFAAEIRKPRFFFNTRLPRVFDQRQKLGKPMHSV